MNIFAVPPALTGLLIFSIGGFLFFNGVTKPRKNSATFSFFCFAISLWLFGSTMLYLSNDPAWALFWVRVGFMGALFIPVCALHFAIVFTNQPLLLRRLVPILYLLGLLSTFWAFDPVIYRSVEKHYWGYYPVAGNYYFIFVAVFISAFIGVNLLLLSNFRKRLRNMQALKARQVFYVLLAFLGGGTGVIDCLIAYNVVSYPYAYLAALFTVLLVTTAILSSRLSNIDMLVSYGMFYSILAALLTGLFVFLVTGFFVFVFSMLQHLSLFFTDAGFVGITVFALFILALIFHPLQDGMQILMDQLFFRSRYDYQKILGRYSDALQPMADLNRYLRLLSALLHKALRLSSLSVLVLDRTKNIYELRISQGEKMAKPGFNLPPSSPLVQELLRKGKALLSEEIAFSLEQENLSAAGKQQLENIAAEMRQFKAALMLPSVSESEYFKVPTLIAIISAGPKISNEPFSAVDINFLMALAHQATVSIEYAFIVEELKKNQEHIVHSEKLATIGTITAGIAHELKNPLAYLSMVGQMLPQKWNDAKFKDSVVEVLPHEVQRMQLIVEGLLTYSRQRHLSLQPIEVKEVIERTLALLGYDITKHKINLTTEFQHEGALANADPNRLIQVFMNIIANAIQAMEKTGGNLNIKTKKEEDYVVIAITDTGPGIPEDKLKTIFDPFYTTKEHGTGLGLAITRKIVEEHKGTIIVQSMVGHGTTFMIRLPKVKFD